MGTVIAPYVDIAQTKIGRRVLGAPVVGQEGLSREEYLVVAVGVRGARGEIRGWLGESEDYGAMA
ncbi:MAG: hypothetical protein MUQ65_07765 [Armatimonadetes bacterium]|nr:hypothetical protein [Armatimonadota bacterium]